MNGIFVFILSAVLGFIFTPVARFFALKFSVLDIPKDLRRVHIKATPLLGGVAVYFAALISVIIFVKKAPSVIGILLGGTLMVLIGVWDDKKDLSAKVKFLFQIIAAVIAFAFGVRIDFLTNPFGGEALLNLRLTVSFLITVFWIVGITNTINIIDGLDGLSSGISVISLLTFAFISGKMGNPEMALMSLAGAGAALGFLPYNFNPASIFLGDGGALFLGFLLATISVEGAMKSSALVTLSIPVLGIAVPIFDTAFAIIRRVKNGKKIYAADKGHLHHRMLARGYSQRATVLILYAISIGYSLLAVLMKHLRSLNALYLAVAIFVLTILAALKMGIFKKKDD